MANARKVGEAGMKKEYIVELREEEADELMDEHWVGELVRCKDCKYWRTNTEFCMRWSVANVAHHTPPNWYCADGERKNS